MSKVNKLNIVLLLLLGATLCDALAEANVNRLDGALLLLLGLAMYAALVVVDEVFGRDSESWTERRGPDRAGHRRTRSSRICRPHGSSAPLPCRWLVCVVLGDAPS